MMNVKKHIELLGLKVKDRVSGFTGVVTTIGFDLYGCIQADVRPDKVGKDGKIAEGYWFDVSRLEIISKTPIVPRPDFDFGIIAKGKKGASEKSTERA